MAGIITVKANDNYCFHRLGNKSFIQHFLFPCVASLFLKGEKNEVICGGVNLSNKKISDLKLLLVSPHFVFLTLDALLSSIFIGGEIKHDITKMYSVLFG